MSPVRVGGVFGDRKSYRRRDGPSLDRVMGPLSSAVPADATVQLVFHFHGSLASPQWDGLLVGKVDRAKKSVTVSIAVPEDWSDDAVLIDLGMQAVAAGVIRLAEAGAAIEPDLLDRARTRLAATGPTASIADDEETPRGVVVSVPVEPIDSASQAFETMIALEAQINRTLKRKRLGSASGHEVGSGSFEIYVETEHPYKAAEAIAGLPLPGGAVVMVDEPGED